MADNSSIYDTFFEECEELLEALYEGLNAIHDETYDAETVNAVFRAVHSIKGGAGAFGLDDLVAFAHTFETVFDEVRSGNLQFDATLVALLFRGSDHLTDLVEAARSQSSVDEDTRLAILKEMEAYLGDQPEEEVVFEAMTIELGALGGEEEPSETGYTIFFQPKAALYKNGHEPLFLFQALASLGELDVALEFLELPALNEFDPKEAYFRWNIFLKTTHEQEDIEEVFEFVEGLCELDISAEPDFGFSPGLPELPPLDVAQEDVPPAAPEIALEAAATQITKQEPEKPIQTSGEAKTDTKGPKPTLRVDLERVDRLINTVGELIINQAMLAQRISEIENLDMREIDNELEDYKLLARDIQEGVMAIRAQPVKPLFQRMARIVREAATATNKKAKLVMIGEGTEVDKTVIERLADPLTHMIRNAVDHGLEDPEKRKEAGKDETGIITLSASHRSGNVFIEISDDGAGLNRKKIFEIAVGKGLVAETAELTDAEVDNLLFLPGFSTANEVSNLSGRGVGMDVVKNSVVALGGRVAISSKSGKGTVFSVVLPLTMAVMDGMVVTVNGHTMVVPITSIIETIRPTEEAIHRLGAQGTLLSIRGNFVPVLDVAEILNLREGENEANSDILLLVETEQSGQCALAVQSILDQRQVVIKSLDYIYGAVPGVSAATILGDGKIAMILDPDGVVHIARDALIERPGGSESGEVKYASAS